MSERLTPETWQLIAVSLLVVTSTVGKSGLLWRRRHFRWLMRRINKMNGTDGRELKPRHGGDV